MSLRENHAWAAIAATLQATAFRWASITRQAMWSRWRVRSAETDAVAAGPLRLLQRVVCGPQELIGVRCTAADGDTD